ncbi:MAG: DUF3291 domain-containing protein [Allorhizobium sp.]
MPASGKRLAIYNFGVFVAPYESPEVEGFRLREPSNFQAAEQSKGFIARSGYPDEPGPQSWGEQVFPRFMQGSGFAWAPSTLSLWKDLESLLALTNKGVHADALKHARHWNVQQQWPALVLWWTDVRPAWCDGAERLERLHDHGAGPEAFNFKDPYGPDGKRSTIDRALVRALAQQNAKTNEALLSHVLSVPP